MGPEILKPPNKQASGPMLLSISFGSGSAQLPKGARLRDLYDLDAGIPFQCLKGRCGRCLVKVIEGDLGPRTSEEMAFMRLMGLPSDRHRLLCQSTLLSDAVVQFP